MRFRLIPSDDGFFPLFNDAAANLATCARNLQDLLEDFSDIDRKVAAVDACERRGDELTHDDRRRVNRSFVVPFDREDIHALTEELDDAVDDLAAAADLLVLHHVGEPLASMQELATIIVQAADVAVTLVAKLPSSEGRRARSRRARQTREHCRSRLPAHGRRSVLGKVRRLRRAQVEGHRRSLEHSVNSIEGIGDIVESIVLKHA